LWRIRHSCQRECACAHIAQTWTRMGMRFPPYSNLGVHSSGDKSCQPCVSSKGSATKYHSCVCVCVRTCVRACVCVCHPAALGSANRRGCKPSSTRARTCACACAHAPHAQNLFASRFVGPAVPGCKWVLRVWLLQELPFHLCEHVRMRDPNHLGCVFVFACACLQGVYECTHAHTLCVRVRILGESVVRVCFYTSSPL